MLRDYTERMLAKGDLSFQDAHTALNAILDGECSDVEIAAFLTALAAKGETGGEMAGMARAMRDHAVPVRPRSTPLIDIVGTGGDGSQTFNISTTAGLVAAGAGAHVAKHGNRAITSKCGSADLLAELGVKIDAKPEVIERCIDEAGFGFMFAPAHHPAMKHVQPIRKALGFRTAFNVLGPLANPANVEIIIIGVAKPYLLDTMADALLQLGARRAMVVYGDGTDEFTICGPTDMMEVRAKDVRRHVVDYSDYGIATARLEDLAGGTLAENAQVARDILAGRIGGPRRDVVVLNAAAALMISGLAPGFGEGIELAEDCIASGRASSVLKKVVEISNA